MSVGSETYIVPLITIIESLQLQARRASIASPASGEVFWFRDGYVPIVRLHEVFGVEPRATQLHEGLIMVVEGDGRRVGLFVDDLLGQQQVVIKSLETNFRRVDGVSGRDDPRRRRGRADSRRTRIDPRRPRCAQRPDARELQRNWRQGNEQLQHQVKAKLFATLALAGVVMVAVGVLGLSGTKSSNGHLDALFSNRFMPTGWVGTIESHEREVLEKAEDAVIRQDAGGRQGRARHAARSATAKVQELLRKLAGDRAHRQGARARRRSSRATATT